MLAFRRRAPARTRDAKGAGERAGRRPAGIYNDIDHLSSADNQPRSSLSRSFLLCPFIAGSTVRLLIAQRHTPSTLVTREKILGAIRLVLQINAIPSSLLPTILSRPTSFMRLFSIGLAAFPDKFGESQHSSGHQRVTLIEKSLADF